MAFAGVQIEDRSRKEGRGEGKRVKERSKKKRGEKGEKKKKEDGIGQNMRREPKFIFKKLGKSLIQT